MGMELIHWAINSLTAGTPKRKNDFPSLCNNPLLIALQLWVGLSSLFTNHSRILNSLILCRSCAGNHSCSEFIHSVDMSYPEDSIS